MNKKIKNLLITIAIATIGGLFFKWLYDSGIKESQNKLKQINLRKGTAIAEIVDSGNLKGTYVIALFTYNGKQYKIQETPPSSHSRIGLSFPIIFDTLNPLNAEILFEYPMFSSEKKTDWTYGNVTKGPDSQGVVKYQYNVYGDNYFHYQRVKDGVAITPGDRFRVHFLENNPRCSYMQFPYLK